MEEKLDKQTIKEIEAQLITRKKQILNDLSRLSHKDKHELDERIASFPEYGDKADENAQEINDYSTNIVTEKVLEKNLADIDNALLRIKGEDYGVCKYCGQAIGKKRLLARPTASSCISCKTKLQS